MVPPTWEHPRDANGGYLALHDGFAKKHADWIEGKRRWELGEVTDYAGGWEPKDADMLTMTYEEWTDDEPVAADYMPTFEPGTATHYRMYESVSEGTPISPAMHSPEALAHWLADNGASAFAGRTASYEDWLATIYRGGAPTMAAIAHSDGSGTLCSGVELMGGLDREGPF